jgi:hypothetical protein
MRSDVVLFGTGSLARSIVYNLATTTVSRAPLTVLSAARALMQALDNGSISDADETVARTERRQQAIHSVGDERDPPVVYAQVPFWPQLGQN